MSYAPPPEGGSGSWRPTDPYGTMGANQQGEAAQGAPKPGSAQPPLPPQGPAPQGFPGQPTGGGAPWAGAPSDSTGSQVPPPPGGFAPTGYGATGPGAGGYQTQPPGPGAPGSGGNKGMWIAIAAVVGVLVVALGGFGIYKLATGGQSATTAPASGATAPLAGAGTGPSPTAPGPSASAPPTGAGGPSPSAGGGGGSAAPSAGAGAKVLGTASMAGGNAVSEFSILPGPADTNGKKTIIVVQKLTNNSSAPIKVSDYSVFASQNGSLLEHSVYPSNKDPDPVDSRQWFATVQPGKEITVGFAYTLVDSSEVEIEPYDATDLATDYTKYHWQPS